MAALLPLAFSIVLLAAAVQATTGFGFALVAVPLLALATEPRTAVVAVGVAGLVLSLLVVLRERGHVRWPVVALVAGAAVPGMPVGLLVLTAAPERVLLGLIGGAVVGCAVLIWRGGLRLSGRWPVVLGVGVLAGGLSTSTGTSGPPLVAAFQAMGFEPRAFRATLAAIFGVTGVLSVIGFALAGQLTPVALQVGLVGAPAALLGWWGGNLLFHRLDPSRFRRIVLAALFASGLLTAAPAITG